MEFLGLYLLHFRDIDDHTSDTYSGFSRTAAVFCISLGIYSIGMRGGPASLHLYQIVSHHFLTSKTGRYEQYGGDTDMRIST